LTIQLNAAGARRARLLISQGKVDKTSAWSFSVDDGNALLGDGGDNWGAYGAAHLAVDTDASEETKARFKYPVEKGGKVYRSGVIAAKQRAAQQGADAVETEAGKLLELIDGDQDDDDKNAARLPSLERRAGVRMDAPKEGKISGYAALFNRQADIGGWFREQIAPGAFAAAIGRDDVRALFNHDPNHVLGRNANGTLSLSEDDQGLRFEVTPPDTAWARDLMGSIERGDINQCSFAFTPEVQEWDESGETPVRTLRKVRLSDVSVVTYPAYDDTSCAVRSLGVWREAHPRLAPPHLVRARLKTARQDRLIRA
jgi:HK97 family phage prohead protease